MRKILTKYSQLESSKKSKKLKKSYKTSNNTACITQLTRIECVDNFRNGYAGYYSGSFISNFYDLAILILFFFQIFINFVKNTPIGAADRLLTSNDVIRRHD
uniref:Uncharacterized protein n=1 Tax=Avrainvillea sp. HV04061 TaxID=2364086 RepID=A0A3B8D8Z8_9CHLO|nr:hypothetical protein [Avrainvillea sp. HV04061]